jgi:hypothetical protein
VIAPHKPSPSNIEKRGLTDKLDKLRVKLRLKSQLQLYLI